jgi:hypothetical protein
MTFSTLGHTAQPWGEDTHVPPPGAGIHQQIQPGIPQFASMLDAAFRAIQNAGRDQL